jgi:predicted kinase
MHPIALEILESYEKSLEIPPITYSTPFIIAPVGLIGSGKSTLIIPLAKQLQCIRISGDDIRLILKEKGLSYDHVHDIATTLHKKFHSQGHSIAIDSDCASPQTQKFITECEKEFAAHTFWIHITTPEAVILERIQMYRNTHPLETNTENWIQNFHARKPLHENLTMPFICTFDATKDIASQLISAELEIRKELGRLHIVPSEMTSQFTN